MCVYKYTHIPNTQNKCKIILGPARWWLRAPAVCLSSSPRFDSQYPYGDLQSSVTLFQRIWCPPGLHGYQRCTWCRLTCRQNIHTHRAGVGALKCEYWKLGSVLVQCYWQLSTACQCNLLTWVSSYKSWVKFLAICNFSPSTVCLLPLFLFLMCCINL